MILAIAYSHKDARIAAQLVRWIGFLSGKDAFSMRSQSVLLVASQRAARMAEHPEIQREAKRIFGTVHVHIPAKEDERGWPASANTMFKEAIEFVEAKVGDDMLWMEPDCVPITPDWWTAIQAEWEQARAARKTFMGARVPHSTPHLTGNAVYGKQWRAAAESLVQCPAHGAFDVYAAHQTLPNAYLTELIQQIWRPKAISTKLLAPATVIFHQDKLGQMIKLLDKERWKGEFAGGVRYIINSVTLAMKYYHTRNATKRYELGGFSFKFQPYDQAGGVWAGILATDKPDEIAALDILCASVRGLSEITPERFEELTKKKAPTGLLPNSGVLSLSDPRKPNPAALVGRVDLKPREAVPTPRIETVESAIQTAVVAPSQPAELTAIVPSKRPRKAMRNLTDRSDRTDRTDRL